MLHGISAGGPGIGGSIVEGFGVGFGRAEENVGVGHEMLVPQPAEEHDLLRGEGIHHAVELFVAKAIAEGDLVFVIAGVEIEGEMDLAEVGEAGRAAGGFAGFAEGGEKNGDEDGDDADDDEEFDEGKGACGAIASSHR